MALSKEHIRTVAEELRKEFDSGSITVPYIADKVAEHSPYLIDTFGNELNGWIEQELNTFPLNMCELSTILLYDRLGEGEILVGRHGYNPVTHENIRRAHTVWVQRIDGEISLIADITADQFGGPAIYVGPLVEPWSNPDWDTLPQD